MATKYLFFWGHTPRHPDVLGAECLSQWFPSAFDVADVRYATAEHYMMWGKATLFGDSEMAEAILKAKSPAQAKTLGRKVRGYKEETWAEHRLEIVTTGNIAKFGQNPELLTYLLTTGDRVLVEASPMDRIWGIGLAATDERVHDESQWRGLNLLGRALMAARETLRAQA